MKGDMKPLWVFAGALLFFGLAFVAFSGLYRLFEVFGAVTGFAILGAGLVCCGTILAFYCDKHDRH